LGQKLLASTIERAISSGKPQRPEEYGTPSMGNTTFHYSSLNCKPFLGEHKQRELRFFSLPLLRMCCLFFDGVKDSWIFECFQTSFFAGLFQIPFLRKKLKFCFSNLVHAVFGTTDRLYLQVLRGPTEGSRIFPFLVDPADVFASKHSITHFGCYNTTII